MGIAIITQFIPIVIHNSTIHKNITTGLTPRLCLNNKGIRTLFSNRCTANTKIHAIRTPNRPFETPAITKTGMPPSVGHRYGISSVRAEITAKEPLLGISIPNRLKINKPINIAKPMYIPSNI